MSTSPSPSILRFFQRLTAVAALFVIVVGVVAQVGWLLDVAYLKSVVPGFATMKVNTAFSFMAAGGSLWALRRVQPDRTERLAGRVLAAIVFAVGTLSLAQYIAGVDFGIDQLLFRDVNNPHTSHPGMMAPVSAANFGLIGIALFLLTSHPRLSQTLASLVLIAATVALVGYAFGVSSLYRVSFYSSMAIHTATTFALLALGVLAARPTQGLMAIVASNSAGGVVARQLLPLLPVVLFLLGLLRLRGEVQGFYDGRFGLAIMVVMSMIVTTLLVAITARILYHLDLRRLLAEDEIKALNESLERKVAERTRELEDSLAQVKQLQGLLPICAWCKKIRDDQDYWHTVETYVSARTDARFTHGICPGCLETAMKEVQPELKVSPH